MASDAEEVTFLAREGQRTGGQRRQVPITLPTTEFIRRWCNHIQPDQLTKTRYFGGWSGPKRTAYFAGCQQLLGQAGACEDDDHALSPARDQFSGEASANDELPRCPHCEEPALRLLHETPKPSWFALLDHLNPHCPDWYAALDFEEHRRYLSADRQA